jgi:hypothetical protein
MAVTINGTTGVSTPGVANSGNETITGTLAVTGAITGSGLSTTLYPLVSGTAVASTSGTSIDFTSIPSWVKRITVMFAAVSTNGVNPIQVQLGDSGGIETTSYLGSAWNANTSNGLDTTGFRLFADTSTTQFWSGSAVLSYMGSNTWVIQGSFGRSDGATTSACGGSKALSDTLTQIRITTLGGTDTFDAGTINILYE